MRRSSAPISAANGPDRVSRPAWAGIPIDVLCGVVALALGLLVVYTSIVDRGGRLSLLVHMTSGSAIAQIARTDPGFRFVGSHYDGVYFYAIALDPLANGRAHTLIDAGANRYGHPAYGWAAGLLSLFGVRLLPLALVWISLAAMFVAAVAASRISSLFGWSPWGGLVIALNPGLLFAVGNDTSEAFGAALLVTSLWAWLTGRYRLAAVLVVGCCFAKEHLLLVPLGLALWEGVSLLRAWPTTPHRDLLTLHGRRFLLLAIGPALYVLWLVYVHGQFGQWSFLDGDAWGSVLAFPVPFVGWLDALRMAGRVAVRDYGGYQIGAASIVLQVAAISAIVIGLIRATRMRTPVDGVYLFLGALMCFLTWRQAFYPKDMIRGLALAFVLLPAVLPMPRWPVLGRSIRSWIRERAPWSGRAR